MCKEISAGVCGRAVVGLSGRLGCQEAKQGAEKGHEHSVQKQSCISLSRTLSPANAFLRVVKKVMKNSVKQERAQEQIPIQM